MIYLFYIFHWTIVSKVILDLAYSEFTDTYKIMYRFYPRSLRLLRALQTTNNVQLFNTNSYRIFYMDNYNQINSYKNPTMKNINNHKCSLGKLLCNCSLPRHKSIPKLLQKQRMIYI